jgi:S-(hydroxymethyl)glutathione dehydrogenase/alcohol dehydrogenase
VLDRIPLSEINKATDAFHDPACVNVGRTVVEFGGEPA